MGVGAESPLDDKDSEDSASSAPASRTSLGRRRVCGCTGARTLCSLELSRRCRRAARSFALALSSAGAGAGDNEVALTGMGGADAAACERLKSAERPDGAGVGSGMVMARTVRCGEEEA